MKNKNSQNDDLNQLPEFFVSVGPTLASKIKSSPCEWKIERLQSSMGLQPTNEQEISKILGQMKNEKRIGYDGSSNEILKRFSPTVEHYLAKGINKCFLEEIFHNWLKKTKVLLFIKEAIRTNLVIINRSVY